MHPHGARAPNLIGYGRPIVGGMEQGVTNPVNPRHTSLIPYTPNKASNMQDPHGSLGNSPDGDHISHVRARPALVVALDAHVYGKGGRDVGASDSLMPASSAASRWGQMASLGDVEVASDLLRAGPGNDAVPKATTTILLWTRH